MTTIPTSADTSAVVPPSLGYTWSQALIAYADDRLGTLARCARTAPVVELCERHYVVSGPEAVMEVLRRSGQDFRRPEVITGEGVRGDAQYDAWMGTRKMFSDLLRDDSFIGYVTAKSAEEAVAMVDGWADKGVIKRPFPGMMDISARATARAFFGLEIDENAMNTLSAQLLRCAEMDQINNGAAVAFAEWLRPFVPRVRAQTRANNALEATVAELVDKAQDVSFAGVLREAGKDRTLIIEAGVAMFRAGTGGIPGAFVLGLHALAEGVFSAEDLLDADRAPLVLRETLRLFPPVSMICRQTVRDVEVEGFLIPARAEVLISPYVMHRTAADYQPDPEVFRPERWMGLHAQPGAWLPYGAGPHWCVGQPLADAESEVVLPALAQRFTFRRNGSMGPMVADAIMHPADETLYVERR